MPKVYIVNRSAHDFSPAEEFGELVYLSDGPMSRFATNNMARHFWKHLKDSSPDDYIVPSGLTNMSLMAASIFAWLHGRVNLLLYMQGKYVPRISILKELIDGTNSSPTMGEKT